MPVPNSPCVRYPPSSPGPTETLSVNEAYDAKTKSWTTLAPMPDAVLAPGSATLGGRLYCFGGSAVGLANIFNYVQIYQP